MKWFYLMLVLIVTATLISGILGGKNYTDTSEKKAINCQQEHTSIHGVPGIPGFPGTPGVRGDTGLKGDKGDQGPEGVPAPSVGVTYTRWGASSCDSNLVYSGRVGGSHWNHHGGGSNYLCMPDDPEYGLGYRAGVQGHSYVYGGIYAQPIVSGSEQHKPPCAVCYVQNRTTSIMIPARINCYSGWTREYYGYLMTSHLDTRHYRTEYICVDKNMEVISGPKGSIAGPVLYHAEATCNRLSCNRDHYNTEKELNCVVCTK